MNASGITTLMDEHERVSRVLDIVARVVERLVRSRDVPEADLRGALRLLDDYVDRFHHAREEQLLFPALQASGIASGEDPLLALGEQHDRLRSLTTALHDQFEGTLAGDPLSIETFALIAREHDTLSREHLEREDRILFPMAEKLLDGEVGQRLEAALEGDARARPAGWLEALEAEERRLAAAYLG